MDQPDPSTLERFLSDVDFPCDRAELIRGAAAQGADDDTLGHICALPDRSYDGLSAVNRAFAEKI